jgi:hypothetical protein
MSTENDSVGEYLSWRSPSHCRCCSLFFHLTFSRIQKQLSRKVQSAMLSRPFSLLRCSFTANFHNGLDSKRMENIVCSLAAFTRYSRFIVCGMASTERGWLHAAHAKRLEKIKGECQLNIDSFGGFASIKNHLHTSQQKKVSNSGSPLCCIHKAQHLNTFH